MNEPPKRRHFQFHLRTMLIGVTALCLVAEIVRLLAWDWLLIVVRSAYGIHWVILLVGIVFIIVARGRKRRGARMNSPPPLNHPAE
jgi:hypothetical protein